ncbi:MAG: PhzF family phenazine biosynthesis protein [Thermoleophilia bacterium]|nr:PhzF family phenazine biosynthesis protein [Thermoleophilia bacterium]
MAVRILHIDAFTEAPFAGNPAGVCLLPAPRDDAWMQRVAFEMNLPETAFLVRQEDGFSLRWFTPATEVDLCGHGTLASAHALWDSGELAQGEQACFHTRSGLLTAERRDGLIWLDFPALTVSPADAPTGLLAGLGIDSRPLYVGRFGEEYLIELDGEEQVRQVRPDFAALRKLPGSAAVVTSLCTSGRFDFVSRCFAPWMGVDEDPVTGSVHCCLGPFWGERLGKRDLLAYQASARGGELHIGLRGERVGLGGHAVTVVRGELVV